MSHGASVKRAAHSTKAHGGSALQAAAVDPLDPSQLDVTVVGWNNIEQKFQDLRGLLSAPAAGLNANEARAQQKKTVSAAIVTLLDRAQEDCRRLLIEGNAKAAVEGGLKTLRLKEAYYGHGHLQLVPAYFHLARTNQYMDKFKAAEEFLSLAQWTILRNKDVDVSLKAELHQTFGLLYASDSKLDAALKQLTSATYYLCMMNGPEHILTSFGYFDLGNVFAAKSHMEHAMAFYDKVKDIWYQHLTSALKYALEPSDAASANMGYRAERSAEDEGQAAGFLVAANFGIENLQDAVKMLRGIVGLQTERYGRVHPSTARAEYVLGMFMLWNGDAVAAVGNLLKALEISKRVYGERHPITGEIRSLMLNFHLEVPDDTSHVLSEDGLDEGMVPPAAAAPAGGATAARTPTPPQQPKPVPEAPRIATPPSGEQVPAEEPAANDIVEVPIEEAAAEEPTAEMPATGEPAADQADDTVPVPETVDAVENNNNDTVQEVTEEVRDSDEAIAIPDAEPIEEAREEGHAEGHAEAQEELVADSQAATGDDTVSKEVDVAEETADADSTGAASAAINPGDAPVDEAHGAGASGATVDDGNSGEEPTSSATEAPNSGDTPAAETAVDPAESVEQDEAAAGVDAS